MFNFLVSIIFPAICVGCGRFGSLICSSCLGKEHIIALNICNKCMMVEKGASRAHLCYKKEIFSFGYSIYEYKGLIKKIIINTKYKNDYKNLADLLRLTKVDYFKNPFQKLDKSGVFIQPIPVSKEKLKRRGFNQAEIIAQKLSKTLNIPTVDILLKIGKKEDQVRTHSKKQRVENVKNTFVIKKDVKILPKTIILIDDVFTTGATVKEAGTTLLKNIKSLKNIIVFTLARKI